MNFPDREPRKRVELRVYLKDFTFTKNSEENACNLSRGGAFIKMDAPYRPGTLMKFEIQVPEERVITGVGRVVWRRETASEANDPPGIGVKFIKLGEGSQTLLDEVMDNDDFVLVGVRKASSQEPKEAAPEPSPPASVEKPAVKRIEEKPPDQEAVAAPVEAASRAGETKQKVKVSSIPPKAAKQAQKTASASVSPKSGKKKHKNKPEIVPSKQGEPKQKSAATATSKKTEETKTAPGKSSVASTKGRSTTLIWLAGIAALIALVWLVMGREEPADTTAAMEETETQAPSQSQPPAEDEERASAEAQKEAREPALPPKEEVKEVPVEEVKASPPVDFAVLDVTSKPEGATVLVDGVAQPGVTPLKLENLPLGKEVEITVHLTGYSSSRQKYVAAEKTGSLSVELSPAVMKFEMISRPNGTRIIIDGKWNGNTPYTFLRKRYKPEFKYRLENRGYTPIEGTVTEKDWVEDGKYYVFSFSTPLTKTETEAE